MKKRTAVLISVLWVGPALLSACVETEDVGAILLGTMAAKSSQSTELLFADELHQADEDQLIYLDGEPLAEFYLGRKTDNRYIRLFSFPKEDRRRTKLEQLIGQNIFVVGHARQYPVSELRKADGNQLEVASFLWSVIVINDFAPLTESPDSDILTITVPSRLTDTESKFSVKITNPLPIQLTRGVLSVQIIQGGEKILFIKDWQHSPSPDPAGISFDVALTPKETKIVELYITKLEETAVLLHTNADQYPRINFRFLAYGRETGQLVPLAASQQVRYTVEK